MRARNIKPGFYKNDQLAECSLAARLLFPGLWMIADRDGRLEYREKKIKAEVFPYDNIEVAPLVSELAREGLVVEYEVGGTAYLWITGFKKHQNPHRNEKASELPVCPQERETTELQQQAEKDYTKESCKGENDSSKGTNDSGKGTNEDAPRSVSLGLTPDSLIPDSLIPDSTTPLTPLPGEVENPASPGGDLKQGSPSQKTKEEPEVTPEKTLPDKSGPPPCPHDEIVAAYHELLPECPRVRVWGAPNRKQMAARWRESKERQSLEWWRHVFSDVSQSDFLMGRTARDGPFVFSLGWFVKPTNFAKVLNGQYENRKQKSSGIRVGGLTF